MPLTINNNGYRFNEMHVVALTDGWWLEQDGSVWFINGKKSFCFNLKQRGLDPKFVIDGNVNYKGSFCKIEEPNITIDIR